MTNETTPPPLELPQARHLVREYRAETGRRTAVLDDDPTGSQSVHGVSVVTALDADEYAAALADPGSTCFILTNTRSLDESDAAALNLAAGRALFELEQRLGAPLDVVSRSDSTLRGHVIAEVRALDAARRQVSGRGFDGVLLVPSYFEAGRFTAGDTHWAMVGGQPVPAGETSSPRMPRSATPAPTWPRSLRKRAEEPSPRPMCSASLWRTSAPEGPRGWRRSSARPPTCSSSWSMPPNTLTSRLWCSG